MYRVTWPKNEVMLSVLRILVFKSFNKNTWWHDSILISNLRIIKKALFYFYRSLTRIHRFKTKLSLRFPIILLSVKKPIDQTQTDGFWNVNESWKFDLKYREQNFLPIIHLNFHSLLYFILKSLNLKRFSHFVWSLKINCVEIIWWNIMINYYYYSFRGPVVLLELQIPPRNIRQIDLP